ncbi:MAG: cytochrome c biogenesis protein ResB [Thermodesulfobacteriota bacterium]
MSFSRSLASLKSRVWGSLTSIRLTVFLLLVLALVAIIGTLLPQGEPLDFYLARYGNSAGAFLWRFRLTQIYYGPWFLGPLSLLAANLLACLVHGLPQALSRVSRPFTGEVAAALPERGRFSWPAEVDPHGAVVTAFRQELGRPRRLVFPDQEIYLVECGRFRPLGPYIIHLALLLILVGGVLGKFWGLTGSLALGQGETAQTFVKDPRRPEQALNFQVRLDRFQVRFYPSGVPEEYRSDLTFLQDGREVRRAICRVNDPVSFGGLTFYQSSYGAQPTGPIRFKVCRGEDCHPVEAPWRRRVELPGGQAQIIALRLEGDLQGLGPAVQVAYKRGPGHPQIFWVSQNHPELAGKPGSPFWQPDEYRLTLTDLPFRYYSVLQVKKDPGVWWVYGGFILVLAGLFLAFFRSPQRWALILKKGEDGSWAGRLLGSAPRAREAFGERLTRLKERLKKGAGS